MQYPANTMTSAETPVDPADGYALVKNLIFDQVYRFRRRFGGDVDELISIAHLAFAEGHNQFVSGTQKRGKPYHISYAAQISLSVWYDLFDAMRREHAQKRHAVLVPIDGTEELSTSFCCTVSLDKGFDVVDWAPGLSEDAKYVVELLLYPPAEVKTEIVWRGSEPRNYRSTLRAYLMVQGWPTQRVSAAFAEIKAVLR